MGITYYGSFICYILKIFFEKKLLYVNIIHIVLIRWYFFTMLGYENKVLFEILSLTTVPFHSQFFF